MTLTSNFFLLSIQICKLTSRKLLYTQSPLRYHIDRCLSRSHRGTLYLSPQPFLLQHSLTRRASRWGTVAFSQSICTVNFLIFLSLNFHHNPLMWRNLRKMDSLGMKSTKDSSNYVFNSLQSLVDRLFGLKYSDVSSYCESPYLQKGGGEGWKLASFTTLSSFDENQQALKSQLDPVIKWYYQILIKFWQPDRSLVIIWRCG